MSGSMWEPRDVGREEGMCGLLVNAGPGRGCGAWSACARRWRDSEGVAADSKDAPRRGGAADRDGAAAAGAGSATSRTLPYSTSAAAAAVAPAAAARPPPTPPAGAPPLPRGSPLRSPLDALAVVAVAASRQLFATPPPPLPPSVAAPPPPVDVPDGTVARVAGGAGVWAQQVEGGWGRLLRKNSAYEPVRHILRAHAEEITRARLATGPQGVFPPSRC